MFSEKYIEYVKKTANSHYTLEMAACALIEEFVEFDNEVDVQYGEEACDLSLVRDELGDVYYQFVLFVILTGVDLKDLNYIDVTKESNECILAITSQFKKLITRGKQLDIELIKDNLNMIYSDIMDATHSNSLTVEEVERYNIEKLNERYADVNA